jgi:peptidyl-dipeptidase Dcp
MNIHPKASVVAVCLLVSSCAIQPAREEAKNPLLSPSPLPFQAPPFDKIKDTDFAPAFDASMKQQLAEVSQIADNTAPPSFDNTIAALEKAGRTLTRVSLVFNALSGANTDAQLGKLQEEEAPKLAAQQDAINLNPKLFARIEKLYNGREKLGLDPESTRLLEYDYQQFVMAGARLSEADKDKLKKLNQEDAGLSAKFINQLLAATKAGALVVHDQSELAGLSRADLDVAAEAAKSRKLDGAWVLALQNTTQQPLLQSLSKRETRQKLFNASWTRAEHGDANDTRATILRLAKIRADKAALLGQPNFAAWRLQDQMAKTPERVRKFLDDLTPAATAKAREEAADIQALIDKQHGGVTLEPSDWNFYSEQVRKARYDVEDSEIKPYFELDKVLQDGVFYAAHQLYGLTFKQRHDLPVYNPDVRVFEVFDKDGSHLALFYCDYFKRDNKNGGAWMDILVGQSKLLNTQPVVYNVANLRNPLPDSPRSSVLTMSRQCSTNSATPCMACSPTRSIRAYPARRSRAITWSSHRSLTNTGLSIPRCWRTMRCIIRPGSPCPPNWLQTSRKRKHSIRATP